MEDEYEKVGVVLDSLDECDALMQACEEAGFLLRSGCLPTKVKSSRIYDPTVAFRLDNSGTAYLLYTVNADDFKRKGGNIVSLREFLKG